MIITKFNYKIGNRNFKVYAKARSVNLYEAKGLQILVTDEKDNTVKVDTDTLGYIEEEATMLLFEQSEDDNELNFED